MAFRLLMFVKPALLLLTRRCYADCVLYAAMVARYYMLFIDVYAVYCLHMLFHTALTASISFDVMMLPLRCHFSDSLFTLLFAVATMPLLLPLLLVCMPPCR